MTPSAINIMDRLTGIVETMNSVTWRDNAMLAIALLHLALLVYLTIKVIGYEYSNGYLTKYALKKELKVDIVKAIRDIKELKDHAGKIKKMNNIEDIDDAFLNKDIARMMDEINTNVMCFGKIDKSRTVKILNNNKKEKKKVRSSLRITADIFAEYNNVKTVIDGYSLTKDTELGNALKEGFAPKVHMHIENVEGYLKELAESYMYKLLATDENISVYKDYL